MSFYIYGVCILLHRILGFHRLIGHALFFCMCGIGWPFTVKAEKERISEEPILETTDFEVLNTDNGVLKYLIKAHKMRQYQNGNLELEGNVEIVAIDENSDQNNEEGAIYIQADRLSYNKEHKTCIIEGNVLLRKPKEQLKLVTERLSYDTEAEVIFTDTPIEIEQKKNVLKGSGLRANKDFKKYTITAPSGTVDTEQMNLPRIDPEK